MSVSSMSRHAAAALLVLAGSTSFLLTACGGDRTPLEPSTAQIDTPAGGSTGTNAPNNGTATTTTPGASTETPPAGGTPITGLWFQTGSRFGTVGTRLLITPVVRLLDQAGRPVA